MTAMMEVNFSKATVSEHKMFLTNLNRTIFVSYNLKLIILTSMSDFVFKLVN